MGRNFGEKKGKEKEDGEGKRLEATGDASSTLMEMTADRGEGRGQSEEADAQ